ncbi:MAG: tRNA (adenosine(37)-N6)-threonylcarbamoyltransferase complex transferase subunit TsaD [Lewinella sp.]|nr:tRNA (adenosine(37)-N6)-threonylcarbamoyltransferase complex transferase subunit TsaD [Lewinella sp.]
MSTTILAIESSCDDTSAAVIRDGQVLSNLIANQSVHEQYGGVVPEVASRAHLAHIIPVVDQALKQAGASPEDISAVAFTRGPGLLGSLIVGVAFAKSFALARQVPLIEVHHLQAHVLAHFAEPPYPSFPFLCLTVSGGHTQIVLVRDYLDMESLGQTLDDAAGEAFDKIGKEMGLPYPAGPHIDRLAQDGEARFSFPEPQIPDLNFSFSGLKTNVKYFLEEQQRHNEHFIDENLGDLCRSVQDRIVSILLNKLEKAVETTGIREVAIGGGVSANSSLRRELAARGDQLDWTTHIPAFQYCTDNAGMIGITAYYKYLAGQFTDQEITATARIEGL